MDRIADIRDRATKAHTIKPYTAGDTVSRYCGKAGRHVVATINPLNWHNPDHLAVYCPTTGCTCPMDVPRLPVRYEHEWPPTWADVQTLLDALPNP